MASIINTTTNNASVSVNVGFTVASSDDAGNMGDRAHWPGLVTPSSTAVVSAAGNNVRTSIAEAQKNHVYDGTRSSITPDVANKSIDNAETSVIEDITKHALAHLPDDSPVWSGENIFAVATEEEIAANRAADISSAAAAEQCLDTCKRCIMTIDFGEFVKKVGKFLIDTQNQFKLDGVSVQLTADIYVALVHFNKTFKEYEEKITAPELIKVLDSCRNFLRQITELRDLFLKFLIQERTLDALKRADEENEARRQERALQPVEGIPVSASDATIPVAHIIMNAQI